MWGFGVLFLINVYLEKSLHGVLSMLFWSFLMCYLMVLISVYFRSKNSLQKTLWT